MNSIVFGVGFGVNNSNEDEQNILTMELKLIEQKLMGSTALCNTELNKVSDCNEALRRTIINRLLIETPDHIQFTSSQNSIDQFLWSPSNVGTSPSPQQPNQLLMKFWSNPKQASNSGGNGGNSNKPTIPSIIRNQVKIGSGQPIVSFNHSNCDELANDTTELDVKIKDVHSPHRDFKPINSSNSSSSNINSVNIGHTSAPKGFGCDDTYEDGIDKDMRDLERRLESELEEHEKLWSPDEETPISQT